MLKQEHKETIQTLYGTTFFDDFECSKFEIDEVEFFLKSTLFSCKLEAVMYNDSWDGPKISKLVLYSSVTIQNSRIIVDLKLDKREFQVIVEDILDAMID